MGSISSAVKMSLSMEYSCATQMIVLRPTIIDGILRRFTQYCCSKFHILGEYSPPYQLGTHGNTETGDEVMENIIFRNIDILEHDRR